MEAALAAFAHEVRTPLTGILAISNLLATSELGERERRWVDTIKAGAEHLASLATLFVDAARSRGPHAGRQDLFDLRALGVVTVATFGIIGYVMEENGYPVAAMVLGIVMGTMVEQAFVTSLIKSDGSILPFFERPIAAILAAMAIGALAWPLLVFVWRKIRGAAPAAASAR